MQNDPAFQVRQRTQENGVQDSRGPFGGALGERADPDTPIIGLAKGFPHDKPLALFFLMITFTSLNERQCVIPDSPF